MKKYILLLILNAFSLLAFAQITQISPLKPSISDSVTISYHGIMPNARLNGEEPIYARITNYLQDGAIEKFHQLLLNNNGAMTAKFRLPKMAAAVKVEFYTLNKEDETATQNFIVYQKNKNIPVKGAYLNALFSNKPDSVLQLELANYPDNYDAYARYFNVLAMIKDPIESKVQIKALLEKLNTSANAEKDNLGLLAAICIGNSKTEDLKTAKKSLFEMFNKYPLAAETAFAFSIYNYEYYKSSNKQIEADVLQKIKSIFIGSPTAAICKDTNVFEYLRTDTSLAIAAFEKVMIPQYYNDGIAYHALSNLPELYIARNQNLPQAKDLLQAAIARFQTGTIQHQFRLANSHYQLYVPILLMDLAKVNILQKDNQAAVSNTSAAIQFLKGSNAEGNFMPTLLQLRATTYKAIGNYNLAFDDYKQLYLSGTTYALDSMQRLFKFCNFKQKDFTEFLATLKLTKGKEPVSQDKLGNFMGTDLKGNKVSLIDLKGKLVVLNVWGIGCGPCIAEIPLLNELVKEYKDKQDVVFIAVTADRSEELVKFFKSRVFDYKVLSGVKGITETFNTNALPVHMVIGKNGEVLNRSIGAREDIKVFLKGVIEANL
jgi:thiol-disulfide isomerase/thioredoxin